MVSYRHNGNHYRVRLVHTDSKASLQIDKMLPLQSTDVTADGLLPYSTATVNLTVSKNPDQNNQSHVSYSEYHFAGNRNVNFQDSQQALDNTRRFLDETGLVSEDPKSVEKVLSNAVLESKMREYSQFPIHLEEPYTTNCISTLFEVMDMTYDQVLDRGEELDSYMRDNSQVPYAELLHEGSMIDDLWRNYTYIQELEEGEVRKRIRRQVALRSARVRNIEHIIGLGIEDPTKIPQVGSSEWFMRDAISFGALNGEWNR